MGDDANMENIVRGSTTHLKLLLGGLERTASEYEAVFFFVAQSGYQFTTWSQSNPSLGIECGYEFIAARRVRWSRKNDPKTGSKVLAKGPFGEPKDEEACMNQDNSRSELTLCGPSNLDALRRYYESTRRA